MTISNPAVTPINRFISELLRTALLGTHDRGVPWYLRDDEVDALSVE